jgi:hypothetical protein
VGDPKVVECLFAGRTLAFQSSARARLTAGGEEELHRVAMVLEAWASNDVRVEREWEVACAQADDLKAGLAPSAATERFLATARTRRLAGTPVSDPFDG